MAKHRASHAGSVRALDLISRPVLAVPPTGSVVAAMSSTGPRQTMIAAVSIGAIGVTAAITAASGSTGFPTFDEPSIALPASAVAALTLTGSEQAAPAAHAPVTGAAIASSALPAAPAPAAVAPPAAAPALPVVAPPAAAAPTAAPAPATADAARQAAAATEEAKKAAAATSKAKAAKDAAPAVAAGSAAGVKALAFAKAAIGKPYRYGAAGPNAFDCSGLVMSAFKKAGVSVPRTSSAQSRVGKPVSRDQLKPGDLVFFYSPVSHVGIYMGNGKIVHASTSGEPVKVSDMGRRPFHNARRI